MIPSGKTTPDGHAWLDLHHRPGHRDINLTGQFSKGDAVQHQNPFSDQFQILLVTLLDVNVTREPRVVTEGMNPNCPRYECPSPASNSCIERDVKVNGSLICAEVP
jgi:hypothetical protein